MKSGPRLVLSLTTTPGRIGAIAPTLLSLARQEGEFAEILLHVPHRFVRTGEAYDIPTWLPSMPRLRINRCTDYGPATKLLGALECEADPETLIVTVDDDVAYPPGMVEAYRAVVKQDNSRAYCTSGFNISDPHAALARGALTPVRGHLARAQVAEGFGSCLYARSFFDERIFPPPDLPDFLRYSDDLYISNFLAERGIDIRTVSSDGFGGPGFWRSRVLPHGFEPEALHLSKSVGTNRERYSAAIDYLIKNGIYFLDKPPGYPRQRRGSIEFDRTAF